MQEPTSASTLIHQKPVTADLHGFDDLRHVIEHAAHFLPAQGPITVFVHHNTLHAFEHLPFDEGVKVGGKLFGCNAYLPEERYREKLERGRIRVEDLVAVLLHDLGEEANLEIGAFGTRFALRLAMLQFPLRTGSGTELRWMIAETDALRRFRDEVPVETRDKMVDRTRHWALQELQQGKAKNGTEKESGLFADILNSFESHTMESWSEQTWEAFVLNSLWQVCYDGVKSIKNSVVETPSTDVVMKRHRDLLLEVTQEDTDVLVHEILIRVCSSFLDQGFADWKVPNASGGLYGLFLNLYGKSFASPTRWLRQIHTEVQRLAESNIGPLESIEESLRLLGIKNSGREEFLTHSLLALRGWAGMVWQMETNAEWAPHPAPAGSLVEFLAVRLILDRLAIAHVSRESLEFTGSLDQIRDEASGRVHKEHSNGVEQRAFIVFQLAQVCGWNPQDLESLSHDEWATLSKEIATFSAMERRRIYHLAFERKYRNETLDGVILHSKRHQNSASTIRPEYQVVCCIDEREESFRRHLEECDPTSETFGFAGFYGVIMYYRGAADAHFTPLCPVNLTPKHYVVEEPLYSLAQAERRRAETRRRIGQATHQAHRGTRTFAGGLLAGLFGSFAAFPLVARILFPRTTAQIRRQFEGIVHTPGTELRLERTESEPGRGNGHIGYSVDEMAGIVEGSLRAMGLSKSESFSRLLVICGHGSSSLNNPHEAAHDCGACGGGRGGPNARAFAQMANDPRVRNILKDRDLIIPDATYIIGGYHNTCDDSMTWYDLDRIPVQHRELFETARANIDEARKRSSHERCRRFQSASLSQSTDEALRHVEGRAEDLSQTRPEYGHATNALCFVGRREWSRGLFLDRRAFLTSYNPTLDNENSSTLEGLLQAVIPVCAGINLEYYFSYVDPIGYGCGTKLPHNITSLLGVMDGAASDLRPGLPWQMVEIHEPVRLLFVIESTPEAMRRIIADNAAIAQLVNGDWVQLAVFDAQTSRVQRYVSGEFEEYDLSPGELPIRESSIDWYRSCRDHLGFASIASNSNELAGQA